MTRIEWTDDLSVGLPEIDEQHKALFALANDLVAGIERGEGQTVLRDILTRLREYCFFHFDEEETYMQDIGYPKARAHAAEHALLSARATALSKLLENGESIPAEGAADFLEAWIFSHVLKEDVALKRYADAQG
ncbi:bacteriohemerythrin [Pseudodesulfovibrio cashew]|uniref:Bacteriohemerythrin n=1 Tax=Pseudodesulfovibrio cashew TaxID=2678688 RepID=A0A6I6J7V7_9BACT|nr:bacteriohemerythrin [Pseudodesulfovibrio cashew]QGY38625.1 bacteriohemerythrin [Pseudodesulfovibrio cashew]